VGSGGGQSARFYVGLVHGFVHTCLHEKGKVMAVDKVGGGRTTWPAGNPSLDPYKYPSTSGNQNTHHI
jgi:hypothetical protein